MVATVRSFLWGAFLALPNVNGAECLRHPPLGGVWASCPNLRVSRTMGQEVRSKRREIPQGIGRVESVSKSRSLELLAKSFGVAEAVVPCGAKSAPVSPQKKLGETLEIKQESSGLYSIRGRILEEFESPSGVLALGSIDIDQKGDVPGWLKEKIEAVQKEKDRKKICELWGSVYDCSDEEEGTFPESFADKLRSLYITACLRLFEESPDKEKGEPSEYNLCYAFCTADAVNVKNALKFKPNGVVVELTDNVLAAAGVYLYTLGRLWENPETFEGREFGQVYRKAFGVLKSSPNRPDKNFISWVLQQAYKDDETQKKVATRKPEPFLY